MLPGDDSRVSSCRVWTESTIRISGLMFSSWVKFLQGYFTQHKAIFIYRANPVSPHPDLLGTFLARNIQYLVINHGQGNLQGQGGFADARFSADQHHRTPYKSSSQHPVQLTGLGIQPGLDFGIYFMKSLQELKLPV